MSAFAAALATLHADANVGVPATFRTGGQGVATALRVMRHLSDGDAEAFGQKVNTHGSLLHIRVADVAQVRPTDVVELLDSAGAPIERLVVTESHLDEGGVTWIATMRRM